MNTSITWIAGQLATRFSEPPSQPRFNPRPPGVIRPGSATQAVLGFLTENPKRAFSFFELCKYTDRSCKAVAHACLYLKSMAQIECHEDARNPRYLRYQVATKPKE